MIDAVEVGSRIVVTNEMIDPLRPDITRIIEKAGYGIPDQGSR